jgi:hypothetical protein
MMWWCWDLEECVGMKPRWRVRVDYMALRCEEEEVGSVRGCDTGDVLAAYRL